MANKLTSKQLDAIKAKSSSLEKARSYAQAKAAELLQPAAGDPPSEAKIDEADVNATPMSQADLMVCFEKYKEAASNALEAQDQAAVQVAVSDLVMDVERFVADKGSSAKTYGLVLDAYKTVFGEEKIQGALSQAVKAAEVKSDAPLPSDLLVTVTPLQVLAAGGLVAAPILGAYAVKNLGLSNSASGLQLITAALSRPGASLLPAGADGKPVTRSALVNAAKALPHQVVTAGKRRSATLVDGISQAFSGRNPRDRQIEQPHSQKDERLLTTSLSTTIHILTQE